MVQFAFLWVSPACFCFAVFIIKLVTYDFIDLLTTHVSVRHLTDWAQGEVRSSCNPEVVGPSDLGQGIEHQPGPGGQASSVNETQLKIGPFLI